MRTVLVSIRSPFRHVLVPIQDISSLIDLPRPGADEAKKKQSKPRSTFRYLDHANYSNEAKSKTAECISQQN